MRDAKLRDSLRLLVRQYGLDRVQENLRDVVASSDSINRRVVDSDNSVAPKKKRNRMNALECVAKMELDKEMRTVLVELAELFESKSFLPTLGDIRNFYQIYRIDQPEPKSRRDAVARVFKFMATMEVAEIRRIATEGMFSGPSRLAPIADAIRSRSRSRAAREPESVTPIPSTPYPRIKPLHKKNPSTQTMPSPLKPAGGPDTRIGQP